MQSGDISQAHQVTARGLTHQTKDGDNRDKSTSDSVYRHESSSHPVGTLVKFVTGN